MGGVIGTYTYVTPLLTHRAGIPLADVPLVLIGFGAGALERTVLGGRFGDQRPLTTAITASRDRNRSTAAGAALAQPSRGRGPGGADGTNGMPSTRS
jgi:hypothetical protein